MNLYTADLMAQERIDDRDRSLAVNDLIAQAKAERAPALDWRGRIARTIGHARVLRRRVAI